VQTRAPIITVERHPLLPPSGFLRRILWNAFSKKYELKRIVELVWPKRDTVILNCPHCNQLVATTTKHTIVSIEPLTTPVDEFQNLRTIKRFQLKPSPAEPKT
jgi:hypothetical protein